MLSMKEIKPLCNENNVILTNHMLVKMKERGIAYDDVETAILNGEIVTQYEDDKPHPSCLIFGYTRNGKPLHAVASVNKNVLWIITAYFPTLDIWEDNYKIRKAVK